MASIASLVMVLTPLVMSIAAAVPSAMATLVRKKNLRPAGSMPAKLRSDTSHVVRFASYSIELVWLQCRLLLQATHEVVELLVLVLNDGDAPVAVHIGQCTVSGLTSELLLPIR